MPISLLTVKSQKKLLRAVSDEDLKTGLTANTPESRGKWEREMIIKYNFKVVNR
jgi:hypothetical protein